MVYIDELVEKLTPLFSCGKCWIITIQTFAEVWKDLAEMSVVVSLVSSETPITDVWSFCCSMRCLLNWPNRYYTDYLSVACMNDCVVDFFLFQKTVRQINDCYWSVLLWIDSSLLITNAFIQARKVEKNQQEAVRRNWFNSVRNEKTSNRTVIWEKLMLKIRIPFLNHDHVINYRFST